jgi:hypothetical protein
MTELKTEIEGIFRDTRNNALLNKDNASLYAYKKIKQKNAELEETKKKVNNLEKDVSDIKNILLKIAEKLT